MFEVIVDKQVFKFVILAIVRKLSGIVNDEVIIEDLFISFSTLMLLTFYLVDKIIVSLRLSMIILLSVLSYNKPSLKFVIVHILVGD